MNQFTIHFQRHSHFKIPQSTWSFLLMFTPEYRLYVHGGNITSDRVIVLGWGVQHCLSPIAQLTDFVWPFNIGPIDIPLSDSPARRCARKSCYAVLCATANTGIQDKEKARKVHRKTVKLWNISTYTQQRMAHIRSFQKQVAHRQAFSSPRGTPPHAVRW